MLFDYALQYEVPRSARVDHGLCLEDFWVCIHDEFMK